MFRPTDHFFGDPPEVLEQERRELARLKKLEDADPCVEPEFDLPVWRLAQEWRAQDGHRSEDPYERGMERYAGLRND